MSFLKKLKNSKHFPLFSSSSSSSQAAPIQNSNGNQNHIIPNIINISSSSSTSTTTSKKKSNKSSNNINKSTSYNLNTSSVNTTQNITINTNTLSSYNSNNYSPGKLVESNCRNLVIYHIDSETEGTFSLTVQNDDIGDFILNRVCDHFSLNDYKEYFGLKYTLVDDKGDYEIFWLDPLKNVGKQLKHTNNVLTFRVKHFPGKPELIESEYVRYLIFLQIRNYLLKGDLQLALVDETRLAAYAVQASLGDYDPELHKENYLAELKFLSRKSLKAEEAIIEMHKQLKGKTPADMELAFLEKASQFDTYGAELIVVKNSKGVAINFGVSHNGIITFLHGQAPNVAKIGLYPWTQIGKISYEGRTLKVHAHTPDNKNSEIIKKHVMIFKCNSKRICKHLWKFILDQKAFFNFKRGSDVPKIKSSSSLFSHKSKFRFSGRCESELIASQNEKSIISISPLSINSSKLNDNSCYSISIPERSATLQYTSTFKRRTFLNSHRSNTLTRTNQTFDDSSQLKQNNKNSDANNNNLLLLKKCENQLTNNNNNSDEQPMLNSNSSRKNTITTLSDTVSTKSQQTVIINNNESNLTDTSTINNNNNLNIVSPNSNDLNVPNLTSTPQTMSKQVNNIKTNNSSDNLLDDKASIKKQLNLLNEINKTNHDNDDDDDDNDEFYDHDDCNTSTTLFNNSKNESANDTLKKINDQFSVNNQTNSQNYNNYNNNYKNDKNNLVNRFNSTNSINKNYNTNTKFKICNFKFIIVLICFSFLFIWLLISFNSNSYLSSSSISRLNDKINLSIQSIKLKLFSLISSSTNLEQYKTENLRWIEWPLSSSKNSTSLIIDPIIQWFFSKYEPN